MNAKDTVVGTAKQIVAEIVGDGRLAEEGSHARPAGIVHFQLLAPTWMASHRTGRGCQTPHSPKRRSSPRKNSLLGHAALKVWSDLPRDAQERLFAAAVDDGAIANSLAVFLHDRHPKTSHPPKPSMIA
jgi:hypothetical protein